MVTITALAFSNYSFGQTATINLDYTGATNPFGTCGGSDNTYTNGSGTVNFNGGIPTGASITAIGVSSNLGESFNGTTTFTFTLNGTTIGNITGVTSTCQTGTFNATTIPAYNNTTNNILSFTGSGTGTRGVYNVTLTITYCIPPTIYNVTGGGGYCTGGNGVLTGLSNSETGVNYQLKIGGVNTGSAVAGTGSSISFGNQITAGNYTVEATRGGCTSTMNGSANVSINPLPLSSATSTNITCNAAQDGTITVTGSGGTGPYFFSDDNGGSFFPVSPNPGTSTWTFMNLIPNNPYRIKVQDTNGCISK